MADTPYVKGADKLAARIATIRRNLNVPVMTSEIGELLLKRTKDRFDKEVDPDSKPWKPLAPSTIERKRRGGYGDAKKLVRKGDLRNAIQIIRGGAGTTFTNTGAGVRIGVDDPTQVSKASAQNKGTARIPARRFLGIGALDVKAVDSYLRRRAANLGDS